jgi:uroporphyrinogen-III decarboxylase
MNSKQRVMAVLQGNLPDRVPIFIMSKHYAMRLANLSFKSYLEVISGEKYARAQAEAYRLYGYDGVMDLEGVNADSQAFGSVLAISEDASSRVIVPRIQDI